MKTDDRNYPVVSSYERDYSSPSRSAWNPRSWSRRIWLIIGTVIIVIVVAVVGAVVGVRATRNNSSKSDSYPNYTRLNYTLIDSYSGTSFFDKFEYFHTYDPAGGFVHYVDPGYAATYNLTYATSSTAIVRVDTTVGPGSVPDASTGRFSVRLESKAQYGPGLFLFDVKHTPHGCGTWPAIWLTDPHNWPENGEIDLMEAVNQATAGNQVALHTTSGCTMADVRRQMSGTAGQADCYNGTNSNTGCTVQAAASGSGSGATYGPDFNAAGGGIVALEWRAEGIHVWVFSRSSAAGANNNNNNNMMGITSLPATTTTTTTTTSGPGQGAAAPDPSTWGPPLADFPSTSCDVGSHFRNQSIIVNIDLCGYLAEAMYASSGCPSNCTDFVAKNPSAFANAYWEFGGFQVYKPL